MKIIFPVLRNRLVSVPRPDTLFNSSVKIISPGSVVIKELQKKKRFLFPRV